METPQGTLRIGELARRTGTSPARLRAWQQRYGLLEPDRSSGGLRLYSARDEMRVRAMVARMAGGLAAAQAAHAVLSAEATAAAVRPPLAGSAAGADSELTVQNGRLRDALRALDRDRSRGALDRLLAVFAFETVARQVLLPYLVDVGARWEAGEPTIAEEHMATQLLRARLLALSDGLPSAPSAPRVVLACAPDEHHDIALTILAAALERQGARVTLLGANTPVMTVLQAAELTGADCVVVAVTLPGRIDPVRDELRRLAASRPLFLAGPGVDARVAGRVHAEQLTGDPVSAAGPLAARFAHRRN
ncbi:MAG TPA: cobalamin B12-binding domain-containing protein [Solirubrobacteraceae bacterium]|nr:cobalamin B12-binding domain-containing protein [Solirubrobacteraceae bacterium]